MADEVQNMNILDVNKHWCKLKDLFFTNRHKTIVCQEAAHRHKTV